MHNKFFRENVQIDRDTIIVILLLEMVCETPSCEHPAISSSTKAVRHESTIEQHSLHKNAAGAAFALLQDGWNQIQ